MSSSLPSAIGSAVMSYLAGKQFMEGTEDWLVCRLASHGSISARQWDKVSSHNPSPTNVLYKFARLAPDRKLSSRQVRNIQAMFKVVMTEKSLWKGFGEMMDSRKWTLCSSTIQATPKELLGHLGMGVITHLPHGQNPEAMAPVFPILALHLAEGLLRLGRLGSCSKDGHEKSVALFQQDALLLGEYMRKMDFPNKIDQQLVPVLPDLASVLRQYEPAISTFSKEEFQWVLSSTTKALLESQVCLPPSDNLPSKPKM